MNHDHVVMLALETPMTLYRLMRAPLVMKAKLSMTDVQRALCRLRRNKRVLLDENKQYQRMDA